MICFTFFGELAMGVAPRGDGILLAAPGCGRNGDS